MNHAQEHTLDLYIMNPELLDAVQRKALQEHLDQCEGCRRLAETIRAFYRELEHQLSKPAPDARILMRRIFPAPPILSFLPRAGPATPAGRAVPYPPRARAQHPSESLLLERTSGGGEATVRIFREPDGETCRLVLCPKTFELEECGIASLPRLNADILLDDNGEGVFVLPAGKRPVEWDDLEIVVRFPVAQLYASPLRARHESRQVLADASGRVTAHMVVDEEKIEIAFPPAALESQVKLLSINDSSGKRVLLRLNEGVGTLPVDSSAEEFLIDVYT